MNTLNRSHYKSTAISKELSRKWKERQTRISQQKPPKDHKQLKKANTRAVYKFFNSCNRPKL